MKSLGIDNLAPLSQVDGIDLVNLQHGPAGRAFAAAFPGIIDAAAEPVPLDDFAAAIAATDLLISIDTMAAHCAGAMGHPLWVVLPTAASWHWGLGRTICPWYPSARLFRRTNDHGWEGVIAGLRQRLFALQPLAAGAT
jgi:ADP-heptose:LPS heptosyltransferase